MTMIATVDRVRLRARPLFSPADADRAYDEWGANCGPGAIAAICGITLDELRPFMEAAGFGGKRYTNPTMMFDVLRQLDVEWRRAAPCWPNYGLVRIQWEGPWTNPGVPLRARYRYTHWVGAAIRNGDVGVFDINCMNNGTGWGRFDDWSKIIVPHLTALYPRASGGWHITHALEVTAGARIARAVPAPDAAEPLR
jgi:hypothetical protein